MSVSAHTLRLLRSRALSSVASSPSLSRHRRAALLVEPSFVAPAVSPAQPLFSSVYIHLPFCRRRCYYCNFDISVLGDGRGGGTAAAVASYIDTLLADIAHSPPSGAPLRTVFFGGGTPSMVPPAQLQRVLDALRSRFGLAPGCEVSMECDPATFTASSLAGYIALGVTRVNVGVQSFDDGALKSAGRAHTADDARHALALVRASSVRSWGVDIISGLPCVSPAAWEATVASAVAEQPHHVSVYDLQVERGTAFGRWYVPGESPLPSEGGSASMYRSAVAILSANGFRQYEVSNYAQPGHECAHNKVYWRCGAWAAFGLAAASHFGGRRFTRPKRMADYSAWVAGGCDETGEGGEAAEPLIETLMMGLRLAEGISLDALRDAHGHRVAAAVEGCLAKHVPTGLARFDGRTVRLTSPDGFLLSNTLIADVFAAAQAAGG